MPPQQTQTDPYAALPDVGASDPYATLPDVTAAAPKQPGLVERGKKFFDQLTAQEPLGTKHTGNKAADVEINALSNLGSGLISLASPVVHPVESAKFFARTALPVAAYEDIQAARGKGDGSVYHEMAQGAVAHPVETAEQLAGQIAGGELASKTVQGVKALPETLRKGAQSAVGAGERNVRPTVAKEAQAASDAARKTIASNREATATHAKDVADTRAANAEATRKQGKIAPTQEKLQSGSRELQAQIETARSKALKVGNEKYNTVHEALNEFPADMEKFTDALGEAESQFGETQGVPPIIRRLNEVKEPLTYADLQKVYSELGKELSKGTLPGTTFHAYDQLQEAFGEDMQRIADAHGMGAELTDARNYWRRMKQTFGKPYNPTDAGNITLEKATGTAATDEQANRVRLLGSFDPSIPQTVEHLGNVRKGVASLPKEQPIRNVVKPLPAAPEAGQIHPVDVNTRSLRQNLLDRWSSGEGTMNKYQVKALVSGGLGAVLGGLFGHGEGATIGGLAGYSLGPAAVAKLVETPAVREWLTRPPTAELEALRSLPHADRLRITDTLKQAAQLTGVKVSPALGAIIGLEANIAPRKHPSDEYAGH
jgi:hypothetical protein